LKTIIAVDPGKNGAVAIMTEQSTFAYPLPLVSNELDIFRFKDILVSVRLGINTMQIILEDVHAIFGASAKSTFNFGYICGQINTICCETGCPVLLVQPKVWQKEIWIEEDIVGIPTKRKYKKSGLPIFKTDTKKTSFNAVKRIFPLINIPTTPKSKVPHDGIVDALLLAEFGRRKYK
jgi:hypothetical protein